MAKRPIYIAETDGKVGVLTREIDFHWSPGMSKTQKQKSIKSLHDAASKTGVKDILEISSKSEEELGVFLSAFNLKITTKIQKKVFSVESAFQSSKVFRRGGPFLDLLEKSSREAKKDKRLKNSGDLIKFHFYNMDFPLKPRTYFYDWLYINALSQNEALSQNILSYSAFTDIEFNPKKSINCQAFSAALYVSLYHSSKIKKCLESPQDFLKTIEEAYKSNEKKIVSQNSLF